MKGDLSHSFGSQAGYESDSSTGSGARMRSSVNRVLQRRYRLRPTPLVHYDHMESPHPRLRHGSREPSQAPSNGSVEGDAEPPRSPLSPAASRPARSPPRSPSRVAPVATSRGVQKRRPFAGLPSPLSTDATAFWEDGGDALMADADAWCGTPAEWVAHVPPTPISPPADGAGTFSAHEQTAFAATAKNAALRVSDAVATLFWSAHVRAATAAESVREWATSTAEARKTWTPALTWESAVERIFTRHIFRLRSIEQSVLRRHIAH